MRDCNISLSHIFQSEQDAVGDLQRSSGGRIYAFPHHGPIQGVEPLQQVVEGIVALAPGLFG